MNATKNTDKLKNLIHHDEVQERFEAIFGDPIKASSFLASVLNLVETEKELQKCDPLSILRASSVIGSLGFQIDPRMGMAFIVPQKINVGNGFVKKGQFQIGYKGLIELGHRTDKFIRLNALEVREGEIVEIDRMTGDIDFDWVQDNDKRDKLKVIGYVAFFSLKNGFEKALFMTNNQVNEHAKKWSDSFNQNDGQWSKDFPGMAKKTVLKLLLDRWSPKSEQMQKAISSDQALINDWDGNLLTYPDNPNNQPRIKTVDEVNAEREENRAKEHIAKSTSVEQLNQVYEHIPNDEVRQLYELKLKELTAKK